MENDKALEKSFYDNKKDIPELEFGARIVEFVQTLNTEPDPAHVKVNQFADNSKYLPIQNVEDRLNFYFGGLWQTKNFKYTVIVNELAGDLELGIYHPVLKEWIWRSGAGGTQIQLRAEYEKDQEGKFILNEHGKKKRARTDILDVSKKIMNTVQKDLPHLKAECLKNAAKSFGRAFGASLNRLTEDLGAQIDNVKDIEDILKALDQCESMEKLVAYFGKLPDIQKTDKRVQNLFNSKRSKLKNNGS